MARNTILWLQQTAFVKIKSLMRLRKNNIRLHKVEVGIWKQNKNVSTLRITRLLIIVSWEEEKLLQYR